MPLIFSRETEREWLANKLTKEDITNLTRPLDEAQMEAYTISKLITCRTENSNVSEISELFNYVELPACQVKQDAQ
jgi:putative SOS response-associated peptidase YedK